MTTAEQVAELACKFVAADGAKDVRSLPWKLKLIKACADYRREQRRAEQERAVRAARKVA